KISPVLLYKTAAVYLCRSGSAGRLLEQISEQLDIVCDAELFHDFHPVLGRGLHTDIELQSDLFERFSFHESIHDFPLARCQIAQAREELRMARVGQSPLGILLHRLGNSPEQDFLVSRLFEKVDRSSAKRLGASSDVAISRHHDDRKAD